MVYSHNPFVCCWGNLLTKKYIMLQMMEAIVVVFDVLCLFIHLFAINVMFSWVCK